MNELENLILNSRVYSLCNLHAIFALQFYKKKR
jgi:hypothetical protein